jgi:prephenate dehydrogenase
MLIFFNFGIAAITSTSKNYLDGERNERIKSYIEQNDKFVGELAAQVLKSPIYRMNAMEFFTQNNDIYTKLITTAPNLSLDEITRAKDKYNKIKEHRLA